VTVGVPSGTVTFLFTDIEGSTSLWETAPEAMATALERHDVVLRSAVDGQGGYVFSTGGDGVAAAFGRAGDALAAAVASQKALAGEPWPQGAEIRVRMGLHTGRCVERDGDYFGSEVNRAARLIAAAHGGQIVVSDATAAGLGSVPGVALMDLGVHRLRGLLEPSRVFGVTADGWNWANRPLVTSEASRGNLPRPATEWFGPLAAVHHRAAELGRRRLVTLTGPRGRSSGIRSGILGPPHVMLGWTSSW
jgi:class 3 adenylate cyclase